MRGNRAEELAGVHIRLNLRDDARLSGDAFPLTPALSHREREPTRPSSGLAGTIVNQAQVGRVCPSAPLNLSDTQPAPWGQTRPTSQDSHLPLLLVKEAVSPTRNYMAVRVQEARTTCLPLLGERAGVRGKGCKYRQCPVQAALLLSPHGPVGGVILSPRRKNCQKASSCLEVSPPSTSGRGLEPSSWKYTGILV